MSVIPRRVVDRFLTAAMEAQARWSGTLPRESYLPPQARGTTPLTPEGTDLAIYTWEENGKLYGIAFGGKANKPLWNYRFTTEAQRQHRIDETIETQKRVLQRRQDSLDARRTYQHGFVVGDILNTSWGYDQTNVEFYEVVEVKGKVLVVRQVAQEAKESDRHADQVVAVSGKFVGPAMRVLPTPNGVKIEGHHASKWSGKPVYQTSSYAGH